MVVVRISIPTTRIQRLPFEGQDYFLFLKEFRISTPQSKTRKAPKQLCALQENQVGLSTELKTFNGLLSSILTSTVSRERGSRSYCLCVAI